MENRREADNLDHAFIETLVPEMRGGREVQFGPFAAACARSKATSGPVQRGRGMEAGDENDSALYRGS